MHPQFWQVSIQRQKRLYPENCFQVEIIKITEKTEEIQNTNLKITPAQVILEICVSSKQMALRLDWNSAMSSTFEAWRWRLQECCLNTFLVRYDRIINDKIN